MRLPRPRLLPATIVTMSALLTCKSVSLLQAVYGETGEAHAAEAPTTATPAASPALAAAPLLPVAPAAPAGSKQDAAQNTVAPPSPSPPPMGEGERAVLLSLRERRAALDTRARALDERAAELAAADRRLEERVQQLSALQARLEGLEAGRAQHRAENWAGLVKTYEAMKPREAAAIFDVLDMQVLLQVLDRMQERRAAPVLAAMQPDRARLATQLLAEMRTRAVTPAEPAPTAPKG